MPTDQGWKIDSKVLISLLFLTAFAAVVIVGSVLTSRPFSEKDEAGNSLDGQVERPDIGTIEEIEPGDDASNDSATVATGEASGNEPDTDEPVVDESAVEEPASPEVSALQTTAPFMQAKLTGREMVLTGTLPNQELVDSIVQSANLAYAPFVKSELTVDPELPEQEWLEAAPVAAVLTQVMTEGSVTLTEGRLLLEGSTASEDDVDRISQRLTAATGLPIERGDIEITDQRHPIFILAGSGNQLALSGSLPNEEIRVALVEAANTVFGEKNVLDGSNVDPSVATSLWMFSPEPLITNLAQFPEFEVRLDGGAFTASFGGGAIFSSDSSEISPKFSQVLNFGAVVMVRDPFLVVEIEGHTDSAGSDESNLLLSQSRADSVAEYLISIGIAADRIQRPVRVNQNRQRQTTQRKGEALTAESNSI